MRRALKIVLVLVVLCFLAMLGTGLAIKVLLAGNAAKAIREELTQRFPVEVELGDGDFDLKQWFLLRPAVTLNHLAIGNPEGFSDLRMIEAGEISAQVSLTSLFSSRPRVEQITIVNPTLRIETNEYGRNNLSSIAPESAVDSTEVEAGSEAETEAATAAEAAGGSEPQPRTLAIDALTITGGKLMLVDLPTNETLTFDNLELGLRDFSTTTPFPLDVSATLYDGERSTLSFSGLAGPFLQESFPADGDLSIILAMVEVPEKTRIAALGKSLRDPGVESIVHIDTRVSGDLMGTLDGGGTISFEGFEFGRDAEHRLPLSGKVPLVLTVQGALNNPSLNLKATNAGLELGGGKFEGDLQLRVGHGGTRGQIQGAIAGVDIDEMLSTFTESSGKIYGLAAIPKFRLEFAGASGDELMDSLTGSGNVTLEEGRITFMDTIDKVLTTAGAILKLTGLGRSKAPADGAAAKADGETAFTTMSSEVAMSNRIVRMSNISLISPAGNIDGRGQFNFDAVMDFDLNAHISGNVAGALGGKPDADGVLHTVIPFAVTGTFANPKVRPDVAHLAIDTGTRILEGLFGKNKPTGESKPLIRTPSIFDIFKKLQPEDPPGQ